MLKSCLRAMSIHGKFWVISMGSSKSGRQLPENEYKKIGKNIWIHKTAQMAPTTAMGGPMIIGPKVQIRNGAFLRGSVILGQHVVIGNSCEIKNSIIFDEAQVPHFNYVAIPSWVIRPIWEPVQ